MNAYPRNWWILTTTLNIFCCASAGLAGTSANKHAAPDGMITGVTYNYAEVPESKLTQAKEEEAARILDETGVAFRWWLDHPSGEAEQSSLQRRQKAPDSLRLVLRILPRSLAERTGLGAHTFGFALPAPEAYMANVFYCAQELAGFRTNRGAVILRQKLANLIAHEIGQLLLGQNSHAAKGIMHVPWGGLSLALAASGKLLFTRSEVRRIRTRVAQRNRAAQFMQVSQAQLPNRPQLRGEPPMRCPQISVRLYDYAKVPTDDLSAAQREAARVLKQAGIETIWVDCPLSSDAMRNDPACREELSPTDVVLRILPQSMVPQWTRGTALFGYALPGKEREFGVVANVFYHCVEDLAAEVRALPEGRIFSSAVILGHVIAHELGHLLLGANSHSRSGIMSFPWGRDLLQRTTRGTLLFTGRQCTQIQAAMQARLRPAGAARPKHPSSSTP